MIKKGIVLILFPAILFFSTAVFCQEAQVDTEMDEAVKLQKEVGKADKELELIEKQSKIAELKKKMAQDLKDAAAIPTQGTVGTSVGYEGTKVNLSDSSGKSQIEIKMILLSAENKKALIKAENSYSLVKVGDILLDDWQVAEIDKESVLFKKGELLKRYRVSIW